MAHDRVLEVHRGDPLAAGLDHILRPIRDLYEALAVDSGDIARLAARGGTPDKAPFVSPVDDFYLTNPIARASAVMAECSVIAEGYAARAAAE